MHSIEVSQWGHKQRMFESVLTDTALKFFSDVCPTFCLNTLVGEHDISCLSSSGSKILFIAANYSPIRNNCPRKMNQCPFNQILSEKLVAGTLVLSQNNLGDKTFFSIQRWGNVKGKERFFWSFSSLLWYDCTIRT